MSLLTVVVILIVLAAAATGIIEAKRRHRDRIRYLSADDKAFVHVRWHEIEQRTQPGGSTNYRQAVIDGDNLVDYCLKQLSIPGTTMGERLRNSGERFSDYEGLWVAHKLRNQLVHEVNRHLLSSEAKLNITRFKRALADLGVV